LYTLRYLGDPVLRQKTLLVDNLAYSTTDVQQAFEPMCEIMRTAGGVGLAAPQIGVSRAFFIMDLNNTISVYSNPEIIEQSHGVLDSREGCLSLPRASFQLRRAGSIVLRAEDYYGVQREYIFDGLGAIIVQHEVDHLKGRLINDHWLAYH
jgi:peptide deformylase